METIEIKVLLIEDDAGDAELVKIGLLRSESPVALHWERTLQSGLKRLRTERFDIVLSDLTLPDCVGTETISSIRETAKNTPIVVLTDLDDSSIESELMQIGAEDYLVKGEMTGPGLVRAIQHSMQRHENAAQIRQLLREVETKNELLRKKNVKLGKLYNQAHQFVDNVSHEFRTPLTVVKEYVALVREGVAGDVNTEQARLLQVAEDRADDLNTMVDDMLDVSKIEAGVLGTWRKTCTFEDVLNYVRDALDRKAAVKDVELSWMVDEQLPAVYCDPEKAGRVLTNLVVNAIKFCSEPGRVVINAAANLGEQEILISVTDNGPGIDSDAMDSIFQRFKQLEHNSRSSTKGFGLGLGIAKELVELNFGQLAVQSKMGVGSTFSFTLPLADPIENIDRYLQRLDRVEYADRETSVVSIIEVSTCESADIKMKDDVDAFLNYCLRSNDILFRVGEHQWIVALPEESTEVSEYLVRVQNERKSANRNRPLGPLSEIEMSVRGCWPGKTRKPEIIDCVRDLVDSARQPVFA